MTQAARGWPSGGQWGESGWTGLTPDLGPGGGDGDQAKLGGVGGAGAGRGGEVASCSYATGTGGPRRGTGPGAP